MASVRLSGFFNGGNNALDEVVVDSAGSIYAAVLCCNIVDAALDRSAVELKALAVALHNCEGSGHNIHIQGLGIIIKTCQHTGIPCSAITGGEHSEGAAGLATVNITCCGVVKEECAALGSPLLVESTCLSHSVTFKLTAEQSACLDGVQLGAVNGSKKADTVAGEVDADGCAVILEEVIQFLNSFGLIIVILGLIAAVGVSINNVEIPHIHMSGIGLVDAVALFVGVGCRDLSIGIGYPYDAVFINCIGHAVDFHGCIGSKSAGIIADYIEVNGIETLVIVLVILFLDGPVELKLAAIVAGAFNGDGILACIGCLVAGDGCSNTVKESYLLGLLLACVGEVAEIDLNISLGDGLGFNVPLDLNGAGIVAGRFNDDGILACIGCLVAGDGCGDAVKESYLLGLLAAVIDEIAFIDLDIIRGDSLGSDLPLDINGAAVVAGTLDGENISASVGCSVVYDLIAYAVCNNYLLSLLFAVIGESAISKLNVSCGDGLGLDNQQTCIAGG